VVAAATLYGTFVYIRVSAGPKADTLNALGQQQGLSLQPKTGGTWRPLAGSLDGVVVLGMHRSGTSMATGLLQKMGLHLGEEDDLLGAQEGENDKGFFERLQVVVQNDDLMQEQDVNWSLNVFKYDHLLALVSELKRAPMCQNYSRSARRTPHPHHFHFHAPPPIQEHALTNKVDFSLGRTALAYFNDPVNQPWAVKDPRLCFTLRFWLPFWRTPPAVLFVYRHPVEVAKSLIRRGSGFGLPRALYLWIAYNRLAIQNSQGLCRVATSYAALIQDGADTLAMIYEQLRGCGVDVPRMATTKDIKSFIDPSLHHHMQNHAEECHPTTPKLWRSEAATDHEQGRQNEAFARAIRVYCAMEDGSAFNPSFKWEDLDDRPPQ
jgi:hypothetical protein